MAKIGIPLKRRRLTISPLPIVLDNYNYSLNIILKNKLIYYSKCKFVEKVVSWYLLSEEYPPKLVLLIDCCMLVNSYKYDVVKNIFFFSQVFVTLFYVR